MKQKKKKPAKKQLLIVGLAMLGGAIKYIIIELYFK